MPAQPPALAPVEDGPWAKGCDSYLEPTQIQKGFYRWGVNVLNRGGIIRTRPGFSVRPITLSAGAVLNQAPRGLALFTAGSHITYLVAALGTNIYYIAYPFEGPWTQLTALNFAGIGPVCFTRCVRSVITNPDHSATDIDPVPMLMIQDGVSTCAYWDGTTAAHIGTTGDPSKTSPWNPPKGLWCEWSGNRYWVSSGPKVWASDLLNPLQFYENTLESEGGFLQMPDDVTGMSNNYNVQSGTSVLLVFTAMTTSTLQSYVTDRTTWGGTPGFQVLTLPGIGCVGGNAITHQWGIKFWYSHDGLIGYDESLRVYQLAKVTYKDREMTWSKGNISPSMKDRIALGSYENLLLVSAPSGDIFNAHTWVMDEAPLDVLTYWGYFGLPSWAGIWEGVRPVAWITGVVHGQNRVFCLSQDYNFADDPSGTIRANIWEAVIDARVDYSVTKDLDDLLRPISCQFETKLLGYDGTYKFFRFAEIYVDNVEGEVNLLAFYAPRRGGYKQVLKKRVIASDWIMQHPDTVIDGAFIFNANRPQSRVVRTVSEAKTYTGPNSGDDAYQNVQTSANQPFPRQKDYAFSVLLQWTGRMSITSVRAYFDAEEQETEGIAEQDEDTDRFLDVTGKGIIGATLTPYILDPEACTYVSNVASTTSALGNNGLWVDPQYHSLG